MSEKNKIRFIRRFQVVLPLFLAFITCCAGRAYASPILGSTITFGGVATAVGTAASLLSLISADEAPTGMLNLTVSGNETEFSLTLIGGVVTDTTDTSLDFMGVSKGLVQTAGGGMAMADFWKWDLMVTITNGFINDDVAINGFVQHAIDPHPGEVGGGPQLPFSVSIDTKGTTGTPISATSARQQGKHFGTSGHIDILRDPVNPAVGATLTGTVDRGTLIDSITGFTFETGAVHTPEPSTFFTVLLVLASLVLLRRRPSR